AQITEVLKDYTEKVGPLSPRIVPEYSLKELIFKEIKRKCLLAKKTIYMEEEPEELKKSEIDKVLEKINKDKPNSTTHDV
ncbi:MAG: hypothetical protein NZT61_06720, partial [Deltaproteobacteria bacterium]|nr:hypothetical protein [Deltaproteobacteria bacterium]